MSYNNRSNDHKKKKMLKPPLKIYIFILCQLLYFMNVTLFQCKYFLCKSIESN